MVKQAAVLMDETAYALRDYLGRLEGDPRRLEEVESRLADLDRLKRKYGRTLEEVLAFRDDVARRADEVENASERKTALEKQRAELAERYEKLAGELTRMRRRGGRAPEQASGERVEEPRDGRNAVSSGCEAKWMDGIGDG